MPQVPKEKKLSPAEIAWLASQRIPATLTFASDSEKKKWVTTATAIALAESGGNLYAHNQIPPDNSYGLWQINMIGDLGPQRRAQFKLKSNEDLFSGITNATAMSLIYLGQGWRAWSVYSSGIYLVHIPVASRAAEEPKQPGNIGGGEDQTETIVGGKIIEAVWDPIVGFLKEAGLRVAAFIGGALLLYAAVNMITKKGIK